MRRNWTGIIAPDWYKPPIEPEIQLSAEERRIQAEGLAKFETAPDVARIWEFSPSAGAPQMPLPRSRDHVVPGTDIHLVWPFTVGRTLLHSRDILAKGIATVGVRCGVLFDSNLYDKLRRFVEAREELDNDERKGIAQLVELLNAWNYDYQALPYIIEQYAKNPPPIAREYAFRITKVILQLHTMDAEYFRATHDIRPDPELLAQYAADYGTADYAEIATLLLADVAPEPAAEPAAINFNLLCLMKLVIIRRITHKGKGVNKQCEAFDQFLLNEIGFVQASLRFLALFYFCGRANRLVPTHVGSNVARQLEILRKTAWDLYLGMLPEQMLAMSEEPIADAYFFCTREPQLAEILASSAVCACTVKVDGAFTLYREIDDAFLAKLLGPSHKKYLHDSERRLNEHGELRRVKAVAPISASRFDGLLAAVRAEFIDGITRA